VIVIRPSRLPGHVLVNLDKLSVQVQSVSRLLGLQPVGGPGFLPAMWNALAGQGLCELI
jgi:hypothetical protein